MLAIEAIKKINLSNLPPLSLLTGDDLGQFELLKEQLLKQIEFNAADLNYALFDMKEADYQQVELDLVSLPFFSDEKIIILDHFIDITTAKKRNLSDDELKKLAAELKKRCGCGGSVKDGNIEIQGEKRDLLKQLLEQKGFKVKLAGG